MIHKTQTNEVARLRELLDRAMDSLSDERLSSHRAKAEVARLREENADLKQWLDERYKALSEADDEVARLRGKIERQAERIRYLEGATNHACGTPLSRSNNEVARLRGLLKAHAIFLRQNGFDRQADDLMRHAPALEEPSPRCEAGILSNDRCKNKATLGTDTGYKCCEHHAPSVNGKWRDDVVRLSEKTTQVSDKEPDPEWRELGPDEVIQEGDEYMPKGNQFGPWPWQEVPSEVLGLKVGTLWKYRTRRN